VSPLSANARLGRAILSSLVVAGALTSAASLTYAARGGAIGQKNFVDAILLMGQLYAPLVGVFIAFHFPAGPPAPRPERPISPWALAFAAVLISIYAFAPVILLLIVNDIENIVALLTRLNPLGQVISSGILVFFFSRY
jgi:hypothetical protein